jgi:hypothetical protein
MDAQRDHADRPVGRIVGSHAGEVLDSLGTAHFPSVGESLATLAGVVLSQA